MHTSVLRRRRRALLPAVLLLASVSCGDGPTLPAKVASVDVTAPAASVPAGDTLTLSAVPRDGDGAALTDRTVTWSSDNPAVLKVDGAGRASGESLGTATVTAQSEGKSGTMTLTVTDARVNSVALSRDTATLTAGATLQLSAAARDRSGNTLAGRTVTWSTSAQGVAQVDAMGKVTAVGPGTALITAASEGQTAQATITVLPAPIATLALSPDTATVFVGATVPLTVTARDAAGNELGGRQVLLVSSNAAVATLEGSSVRAVAAGTATITATAEGKTATATITVVPVPIATLTFVPDSAAIFVGGTVQLQLVARDAAGNELPGRAATVQNSNTAAVSLSESLLATGLAPGTAMLTATAEGKTATARVVVSPVPVASVRVTPDSARLMMGASVDLSAAAYDAQGNLLTGRGVAWSTGNPSVATVSATGVVTGVGIGVADIYATSEGKVGSSRITVSMPPDNDTPSLDGLTIDPAALDVSFGAGVVTVRATVSDAASGVAWVGGQLRSASGGQNTMSLLTSDPVSGTRKSGTFELSFSIPAAAEAGDWSLTLTVRDVAGNTVSFTPAQLQARGLPHKVAVTSGTADTTAPVLTALVVDPPAVNVASASAEVVIRATATDGGSGVAAVSGYFRSPSGAQNTVANISYTRVSGTPANGSFEVRFTIPAFAEAGMWSLLVTVRDQVGNVRAYESTQLAAGGFPSSVTVESPNQDVTAPTLSGVTITPSTVNVGSGAASVTVRATVSDAGTGVAQVDGFFRSPSSAQGTGSVSSFTPVTGTRANGSFDITWTIPAGAEAGAWKLHLNVRDQVGNVRSYTADQLQALGLPSTVTVTH